MGSEYIVNRIILLVKSTARTRGYWLVCVLYRHVVFTISYIFLHSLNNVKYRRHHLYLITGLYLVWIVRRTLCIATKDISNIVTSRMSVYTCHTANTQ